MHHDLFIYRIISINNLENDLEKGLFSKRKAPINGARDIIGNNEIISERDSIQVPVYPGTVVNDFVPFYFSFRTPMLYNICTGFNVPKRNQESIIYLCIKLDGIIGNPNFTWCFTNGNAAKVITLYYTKIVDLKQLDWISIRSTDFRNDNSDGDIDRIRKKHSEFLIKDYVPGSQIYSIVVYNSSAESKVKNIINRIGKSIPVNINQNFYF
jgi:hypothetical protein